MKRVGLTGNIASGKSAVADVWRSLGARVVDADVLARAAVAPGSAGLAGVAERFGAGVLDDAGALDRAALRRLVFDDEAQRRALEAIVHPEVERLRQQEERRAQEDGARVVVHMIPLLFETGMQDRFDVVVLVDAPADVRRRRIIETRGLTASEADAMIAAQMPSQEKRQHAHLVIDNDGDLATLRARAAQVWRELAARLA